MKKLTGELELHWESAFLIDVSLPLEPQGSIFLKCKALCLAEKVERNGMLPLSALAVGDL